MDKTKIIVDSKVSNVTVSVYGNNLDKITVDIFPKKKKIQPTSDKEDVNGSEIVTELNDDMDI
ncbi:hypothetical protein YKV147 [Yokapox virus]|uniref:Uncharacterized protein n=1 Tax=Yokapox virus TaxID=1076255 RepID=G3EI39_9POXV|nr:hypothetical protein YKV147 [Yokapox virus]AEN03736.1 unknown protein [Yokapox virus]